MPTLDPWLFPVTAVLLAAVGAVLTAKGLFGRWFRVWGRSGRVRSCRWCRFDLSATEGHTCPECGHTARCEAEHYAGRFRWRVAGLGVVLLLAAVGVGMTPGIRRDGWLHLLPMGVQVRVFHLETKHASLWQFRERLEGRQVSVTDYSGFTFGTLNDNVGPRVLAWRGTACEVAAKVVTRSPPAAPSRATQAWNILQRFGRSHLPAELQSVVFPPGQP